MSEKTMDQRFKELRRPFRTEDVEFKVQTISKDKNSALCVTYVDARHVQERFNDLFEGQWSNEFREIYIGNDLKAVEAKITIGDVYHCDVGSFDNVNEKFHGLKAVYSDAFKRAAVHFGIAVSLYSLPTMFLNKDQLYINRNGEIKGIGKDGEKALRSKYANWLEQEGEDTFGEAY